MDILIITPSNIGDAVLMTPVISALLENFSDAKISVITTGNCRQLFDDDPSIQMVYLYEKKAPIGKKLELIKQLRNIQFDLVVDLKHSILPLLLYTKKRTALFAKPYSQLRHMCDRHLWRLKTALNDVPQKYYSPRIYIGEKTHQQIHKLFRENGILPNEPIVAVAPGARSHTKRWTIDGFREVIKQIVEELRMKVILVGDRQDLRISTEILKAISSGVTDFCGKTDLKQLAAVLKRSGVLITNDSAPMHIAWAVNTPVVAIFGPTDPAKYRPQGPKDAVISKKLDCSPCEEALCKFDHECLKQVSAGEVFQAVKSILYQTP